jgi:hypothetical protein
MSSDKLPSTITSYDLLKTFAVIIMIIDHIGYYFFPEVEWWRAIGRIGFPIWFYLVGHAKGRDISWKLLAGAGILLGMNVVTGMTLLPLNALFTIILLRLTIDYVMAPLRKVPSLLWPVLVVMSVLILPTNFAFEYGTQGFLFAMFGYLVRYREELLFTRGDLQFFMISIVAIFLSFQWLSFGFATSECVVMGLGTLMVCILLQDFKAQSFPRLDAALPELMRGILRFGGRYTLEIYVVHLVIFKLMAISLGYAGYQWLHFELMAP